MLLLLIRGRKSSEFPFKEEEEPHFMFNYKVFLYLLALGSFGQVWHDSQVQGEIVPLQFYSGRTITGG